MQVIISSFETQKISSGKDQIVQSYCVKINLVVLHEMYEFNKFLLEILLQTNRIVLFRFVVDLIVSNYFLRLGSCISYVLFIHQFSINHYVVVCCFHHLSSKKCIVNLIQ